MLFLLAKLALGDHVCVCVCVCVCLFRTFKHLWKQVGQNLDIYKYVIISCV